MRAAENAAASTARRKPTIAQQACGGRSMGPAPVPAKRAKSRQTQPRLVKVGPRGAKSFREQRSRVRGAADVLSGSSCAPATDLLVRRRVHQRSCRQGSQVFKRRISVRPRRIIGHNTNKMYRQTSRRSTSRRAIVIAAYNAAFGRIHEFSGYCALAGVISHCQHTSACAEAAWQRARSHCTSRITFAVNDDDCENTTKTPPAVMLSVASAKGIIRFVPSRVKKSQYCGNYAQQQVKMVPAQRLDKK